jgi:hypothetical protein
MAWIVPFSLPNIQDAPLLLTEFALIPRDHLEIEEAMSNPSPQGQAEPASGAAHPVPPPGHDHDLHHAHKASRFFKAMQAAGLLVIVLAVLLVFMGFVLGVPIPGLHHPTEEKKIKLPPVLGVRLVEWFKLTLRSAASLRDAVSKDRAPEDKLAQLDAALARIEPLKGKTLEREQFLAELEKTLDREDQDRFEELLLRHTKVEWFKLTDLSIAALRDAVR